MNYILKGVNGFCLLIYSLNYAANIYGIYKRVNNINIWFFSFDNNFSGKFCSFFCI